MHILKIKTKITDLSLGQIRPGVSKLILCSPRKLQTINFKNYHFLFVFNETLGLNLNNYRFLQFLQFH